MTIIGKILTFLIFVFSLLFLGFAIIINQTNKDPRSGESWYKKSIRQEEHVKSLEADFKAKELEVSLAASKIATLQQEVDALKVRADTDRKDLTDKLNAAQNALDTAVNKLKDSQVLIKVAQDDSEKRAAENVALSERLKKEQTNISTLMQQLTTEKNLRVQSQIERDTLRERANSLEQQILALVREAEEKRLGDLQKATAMGKGAQQQPPPTDVQGMVKAVSESGLVSVNKGSDHGLAKGHTLEIYRVSPKAEWVCRIRLVEVNNHESVGMIVLPARKVAVQAGDLAGSSILPTAANK